MKKLFILILILAPTIMFAQVADSLSVSDYIFGNLSINKLSAIYIFVYLAILFVWIYKTAKAIKNINNNTPTKFSFSFWFRDNIIPKSLSLISSFLAVFFLFRFADQFLSNYLDIGGAVDGTMFTALVVGLSIDYFIERLVKVEPSRVVAKQNKISVK